jgi:hypothetical protein
VILVVRIFSSGYRSHAQRSLRATALLDMYNSLSIFLPSIFGSGTVTLSLCKHSVDEFPESQGQKDIFETIAILCERLGCPLVFLATSRPAQNIQAAFDREPLRSLTTRLDLDAHNPDSDITPVSAVQIPRNK